jgi:alcohol dehydrogenase YqhD (iron-dependent ADH family)
MENFVFYLPQNFLFGKGEAAQAGPQIAAFGGSKVLLVYGGGSVKRNGSYDDVTASLKAAGIPWTELSGIQANPRSGKVYEGIDIVRREHVDFLLALGGGSVIDTAKAIGVGAKYDGDILGFLHRQSRYDADSARWNGVNHLSCRQ